MRSADVDNQVGQIDQMRETDLFRDPDRPSTRFIKPRKRQDIRIRRAKGRARTSAWRNDLDRRRCPEARDIGMSLVVALVTSNDLLDMTNPEVRFVTAALADLESRGFDRAQTLLVLRRLRNRLVDSDDRQGEEVESKDVTEPAPEKSLSSLF